MDRSRSAAVLITIMLLSLPLVYVAAYCALVVPSGVPIGEFWCNSNRGIIYSSYRVGNEWPSRVFWPLEQLDRQLRPQSWHDMPEKLGIQFEE